MGLLLRLTYLTESNEMKVICVFYDSVITVGKLKYIKYITGQIRK